MNSKDIEIALSKKHTEDFFITEVKNGPTWYAKESLRMDAVAIKKSWVKPCVTVYEVKVSRNDFLRDSKWPQYLEYCNRFYFACPKDLIKAEEIEDPRVGLIWVYENGNIRTVKPIPMRSNEIPSFLFQYILFSKIDTDRIPFYSKREEYIKDYIEHKQSAKALSYQFNESMIHKVSELEEQLNELKRDEPSLKEYGEIKRVLRNYGVHWNTIEELNNLLGEAKKLKENLFSIQKFISVAKEVAQIEVEP